MEYRLYNDQITAYCMTIAGVSIGVQCVTSITAAVEPSTVSSVVTVLCTVVGTSRALIVV